MAPTKPTLSDKAQKALKLFEETTQYHGTFMEKARNRYRSYLGVLEPRSDAASWTSQLAPPYIRSIVETNLSALIADKLAFQVKPRAKFYSPEELDAVRKGAKAHEILHHSQFAQDRFDEKQRPFALQNSIVGFTVAKNYWRSETRTKPTLKAVDVGMEQYGYPIGVFDLVETTKTSRGFFGPTTEVVNVEDFFWHEAAVELQRSPIIAHRVWMHFAELKDLEAQGVYSNVDELKESRDQGADVRLFEADDRQRTKDMIEVLEVWYREPDKGICVCTIGNRKVELAPCRENPFWHGEYPFVVAATEPDLFQIPGHSQVGKIAHIQDGIWDFLNQTSDNTRLQNNFILGVNTMMVPNPDSLEHEPGARWPIEGGDINQAIQVFRPDSVTAQVAMPMIGMLQRDMQNLSGSQPFTSTSEAGRIGADTATEAALVTNLAQQVTKMHQQQLLMAYQRIGQQRTELNQQFIRRSIMVEEIGLDSAEEFVEIAPYLLNAADYSFDITPMAESLMRSEKRAEANALLQTAVQAMPIWLSLAQAGSATLPNWDAFVERWLENYDEDPRQYFSSKPPQQAPPMGMAGAQQPQQAQQPQGPGGVTAPQASSPSSPSHQTSVSPEVFMQRAFAQNGGVANT